MDPYERLGISRTSSNKELDKAYEEKLMAYPEESEERTEIERAYVVIKYERKQKQKRNKRGVGIVSLLLIAGITGGAYYYWGMEEDVVAKKSNEPKSNATFVIGEEEAKEDEKKESTSKEKGKTKEDMNLEESYEQISDISEIFFRELEDALTDRTVKGLSVSTSTYNQGFQKSLNDLINGGYIFDGELTINDIPQSDIVIKGDQATVKVTVDYSSRSYQPYFHERPDPSTIVWQLDLTKSEQDWLVTNRTSLSDSAKGRGMEVRQSVKDDIISTINDHASEWKSAYESMDTSYFTLYREPDYLARQQSYYNSLEKRGVYWEGYFDSIEYSPSSIKISENATDLSATIEAISYYVGDYYDEDDSLVEEDPGDNVPFRYHLKYDLNQEQWFIKSTEQLSSFSVNDAERY
ncbi:hypothetical protein [Exiguobacterium artemiae]|uniref:hypothetical protein n=1 Tax=Exiguobacterium artemiae TaxID=340145 RepID=UPI002964EC22|nr:hypothetical protein [Exiguobacterium sibiricum]MDW2886332.1 hypothetical protein [Exiguobacterium sibiricum]